MVYGVLPPRAALGGTQALVIPARCSPRWSDLSLLNRGRYSPLGHLQPGLSFLLAFPRGFLADPGDGDGLGCLDLAKAWCLGPAAPNLPKLEVRTRRAACSWAPSPSAQPPGWYRIRLSGRRSSRGPLRVSSCLLTMHGGPRIRPPELGCPSPAGAS